MDITEVRVKLVNDQQDKLKAFCSITIDNDFVVRDLKIIEGSKGLFVAMPSRKLMLRCHRCGAKNPVRSNYCSDCGKEVPPQRAGRGKDGRLKLHADIAHPINSHCRELIQTRILEVYADELTESQSPDYQPLPFDDTDDGDYSLDTEEELEPISETVGSRAPRHEGLGRGVQEKRVEAVEAPPDDNFGVGIF